MTKDEAVTIALEVLILGEGIRRKDFPFTETQTVILNLTDLPEVRDAILDCGDDDDIRVLRDLGVYL
jgi:hypothetical protein